MIAPLRNVGSARGKASVSCHLFADGKTPSAPRQPNGPVAFRNFGQYPTKQHARYGGH
jgi:hypothetical protein